MVVKPLHTSVEAGSGNGTGSGGITTGASASVDSNAPSQLTIPEQLKLLRNPVYFCKTLCATNQYAEWQCDFLRDCRVVDDNGSIDLGQFPRNILLLAVNGSGKTELLADVIRYLLSTVLGCVIPVTSAVYRQLEMLKNYFDRQAAKFPGWQCVEGKLTAPNGNYCRWFATDSAGNVESFHAPFVVRVLDEVKSMSDDIVDATNRWHPKLTIWVSSKGLAVGRLYEAASVHRANWRVHEIDAFQCPWIPETWIDQQVAEHGRNSGLIKSMIYNEWNDVDTRNMVSLEAVNRCLKHPPAWGHDKIVVAGVDLSAARKGGDECVITHRQGNKVFEPFVVRGCVTEMEVVGVVLRHLREIKARYAFMDAGGLGGPMVARMQEVIGEDKSLTLIRENFGGKSKLDEGSYDRGTEIWAHMCRRIERRELILPNDGKLIGQIVTREVKPMSDGSVKLVSKDEARTKFGKSPDRADSLALCLCEPETSFKAITIIQQPETDYAELENLVGAARYNVTPDGFHLGD